MTGYKGSHLAATLTVAALATGCASGGQDMGINNADRGQSRVTVMVQNNNWQDANVYLLNSGTRVRLGTVVSMNTERFTLPRSRTTGPVQLVVDLIGSTTVRTSDPILVNPGEEIRWVLQNHLALSSYQVR